MEFDTIQQNVQKVKRNKLTRKPYQELVTAVQLQTTARCLVLSQFDVRKSSKWFQSFQNNRRSPYHRDTVSSSSKLRYHQQTWTVVGFPDKKNKVDW